jgi:hypothetical protein
MSPEASLKPSSDRTAECYRFSQKRFKTVPVHLRQAALRGERSFAGSREFKKKYRRRIVTFHGAAL